MDQARPVGRSGERAPDRAGDARDLGKVDPRRGSQAPSGDRDRGRPEAWSPEEWIDVDELEHEASGAVARGRAPGSARRVDASASDALGASARAELARSVGPGRADRYEQRLKEATRAFEAERYTDALRVLKKLADDAPGAAAVRELHGLTLYRLGRWRLAAKELEVFRSLTDSTEQNPVLADSYRALRQYAKVTELWEELGAASPSAELVTEGRIVTAGAMTDRGDAAGAVRLLEHGFVLPKRPREHHLRRAYALADGYERVGDVVRARELFERIGAADPDFADVRARARALR